MPTHQIPSFCLPQVAPIGTEVEAVNDAVVHYGNTLEVRALEQKTIIVHCWEVDNVGNPGPINMWIEIADYNRPQLLALGTYAPYFWVVLGAPIVVVPTGVTLTLTSAALIWVTHSFYARVGVQAVGAGAVDWWNVQAVISGKGP